MIAPRGGQEGAAVWEGPCVRGVRVGLFVCLCLCRERPPCEGFVPSVTAEGPEEKIRVFPSVPRAPRGAMARGHGQGSVASSGDSTFDRRKVVLEENEVCHTPYLFGESRNQPGSWVVGG